MTQRRRIWRGIAALFTLINLLGAGYAATVGEGLHTAIHVVLVPVGLYLMWRLTPRAERQDLPHAQQADARLEYLQQSVDAIALEVERIGEAQRYSAKVEAERAGASPPRKP